MPDATFALPDLTTFCRLDELGLEVVGQRVEDDRAVLACHVIEPDQWCRRCGCEGSPRDTVVRRLAHVWRHTRRGDKYVTVIIDLTGVRRHQAGAAAGHGRRTLQAGVQDLARSAP